MTQKKVSHKQTLGGPHDNNCSKKLEKYLNLGSWLY